MSRPHPELRPTDNTAREPRRLPLNRKPIERTIRSTDEVPWNVIPFPIERARGRGHVPASVQIIAAALTTLIICTLVTLLCTGLIH